MPSEPDSENNSAAFSGRIFGLLILGTVLLLAGIVFLVIASSVSASSSSAGVIIFIGPIPIVIGSGPNASWLIEIGIILAVLSIVAFLIMNKHALRTVRVANAPEEVKASFKVGFDYFCQKDNLIFMRKRK